MKKLHVIKKVALAVFAPVSVAIATFLPLVSFAQTQARGIKGLIISVHDIINILIGIVASCALLFFIWGLAKFILHVSGDEGAVEEGKRLMKWGLMALFVMVSIWGIVNFLVDASGLGSPGRFWGNSPDPTNPGPGSSVNPLIPYDYSQ